MSKPQKCPTCGHWMVYTARDGFWCDTCLPTDCAGRHPTTGSGCVEPVGHDGPHYAMGVQRMQLFGDTLATSPTHDGAAAHKEDDDA